MTNRTKTKEELIKSLQELLESNDTSATSNTKNPENETVHLLYHAVRCISECVTITDMNNDIIFVNNAFLATYQYEEQELLGNNISMVRSPDNQPGLVDLILPSTLLGDWQGEVLNRKKDGTDFPVFVSASLVKDNDGNPFAMIGVATDITEQKKLELEREVIFEMTQSISETDNLNEFLKSIHQSLKKVLYAENCFVAIYDEGTALFSFPYFIDQFDPKPEPLAMKNSVTSYVFRTGKPLLLTPEIFRKLVEKKEAILVGSPSPSWIGVPLKTPSKTIGVLVLQHYGKEQVYSESDIQFLYSAGSKIAIAIERKQAETILRESENTMRSITDSAHDAITMIDSEGMITFWNPAAERIFGYSRSEAIGMNLQNLIVPTRYHGDQDNALPNFQQNGQGDALGKTLDMEAFRKDGSEISVQVSLSSIKLNNHWHAAGVLRDITGRKKIEMALVKAKQEAELANKFKSSFLANMSHEIRTPLNAIIGFSQLMNRDKMLSDQQKEYNLSIIHAGEHLLALINDILELSKIEAGRVEVTPSDIDLHSLLDDIQMIFRELTRSKNLEFVCEITPDLPRYVNVDEGKLRQIFVNLIGNALKFTDVGGITVKVHAENPEDFSRLFVEIQDTGPGIPEDEIDKLFKHFEQTSSGVNKGSGTGLGLALSRELAILMGGDITVTSEVGKGSNFTFNVEIKPGHSGSVERNQTRQVIGIENQEKRFRILVVDDKDDNLQVASTLLNLVGFETLEAINGLDAISKFEKWNPHLILMDMRMPVMDGYEATSKIRSMEIGSSTPIVALTASTFEDELKKINSLGVQGFIRKPFRESELFNTIGKILNIRYIYEDEVMTQKARYTDDGSALESDMAKLPNSLVLKMQNALSVADIDQLIKLCKSVKTTNKDLAKHLMHLAENYEYTTLEQLLNRKGEIG
jgi:PAS domain S-box-containing protein